MSIYPDRSGRAESSCLVRIDGTLCPQNENCPIKDGVNHHFAGVSYQRNGSRVTANLLCLQLCLA